MADVFTKAKRSEVMSLIRSTGNKATELKLMALMRERGIKGWRRHLQLRAGQVTVRPDFVFRAQRVAAFVDGCFWHGCPRHGRMPKDNREFWETKIARNMARDRKVSRGLRSAGWSVLRVWECALANRRIAATMARIARALGR